MLYGGLIVLIVNVCTDARDVNMARDLKLFTCVSWGVPIDGKGSQAGPIEAVSAHKEPNGWPGRRSSDDASLNSAPRVVDMVDDGRRATQTEAVGIQGLHLKAAFVQHTAAPERV